MDSSASSLSMPSQLQDSRVLIVMTGGTICMRSSPMALVPQREFMKEAMEPQQRFNDGTKPVSSQIVHFRCPERLP
jgi:hypothetical protein